MLSEDIVIDWITSTFKIARNDAVVLENTEGRKVVINVDAFDSTLHWPPFLDSYSAGLRAYRGSTSDVIVRGARPIAVVIALRIPVNMDFSILQGFIKGLSNAAEELKAVYIGGDTDIVEDENFRAEVVSIGVSISKVLGRGNARPGDIVAVTGDFGVSSLIYEIIKGKTLPLPMEETLKAWLTPKWPSLEKWFENTDLINASIDNSDGLALSLHYLAESSQVGLELDNIPIYKPLVEQYGEREALERALYQSGEEYNFIFTIPPDYEWLVEQLNAHIIGRVVQGEGVQLAGYGPIERRGWIGGRGYSKRV